MTSTDGSVAALIVGASESNAASVRVSLAGSGVCLTSIGKHPRI
jgi:hypothetical protein